MSAARGERTALVHILALFSLAVTYPLLEVLGRSPEFFVAHRLEGLDLAAFVLLLAGAAPALAVLAAWLAGRLGPRLLAWVTGVMRALLAAAVVLQAVRHVPLPGYVLVAIALASGAVIDLACRRFSAVRLFVAMLSPAFVVAPLLFAFSSPASALFRPAGSTFFAGQAARATVPVVFVVFDQLPLVSLLDADGGIDRAAYPNFAALADTAVWFRQTNSVADRTEFAIPAILDGRYPRPGDVPTAARHPDNLFTGLASTYELHVQEPMTRLCPARLCPDELSLTDRLEAAGKDASIAYLHRLLPADLAASLPDVRHDWRGFWHEQAMDRFKQSNQSDRRPLEWVDAIAPTGSRPGLHFAHVLLPHEPFIHLPSGQVATTFRHLPGLSIDEDWTKDETIVAANYQRHLLQVGAADGFLGRLLDRLRKTGLFDEALIVITADHGASFRPGRNYKRPTRWNFPDIMSVPFLLKLPHQRGGRVVDRPVETVDILPTIAEALQIPRPPQCDGRSALDERAAPKESVRMWYGGARLRIRIAAARLAASTLASARRKIELFGTGPAWSLRLNYGAELIGRPVTGFEVVPLPNLSAGVDRPRLYQQVEPTGDFVPSFISGVVRPLNQRFGRQLLAIAVNGIVAGTSRAPADQADGEGVWAVVARPEAFKPGKNDIAVYEVDVFEGGKRFVFRNTAPLTGGAW